MFEKRHQGQGAIWIIIILAIMALIAFWISKKPGSLSTTIPANQVISPTPTPTPTISISPTPLKSLDEIGKSLKDLDSSATEIDKNLNDTQLDVMQ